MKRAECLIVVLMAATPGLALAEEPVYFADTNLKAVVEAKIGIYDPTPTDMLALTVLEAGLRSWISDLTGLEYATNLTSLSLVENQISDISVLLGLTNLRELGLRDNQISDISAVAGLTNLMYLRLKYNQISDISVLSGLRNMTILALDGNQISDISALSRLTNLSYLNLKNNPLNQDACNIYIPLIRENNPGINLYYDPSSQPQVTLPTVATQPATDEGETTATLWGSIEDDGGEACQYRFKYETSGLGYSSGHYTSWTGSKTTGQSFSRSVSVWPGSIYYFYAKAKNSAGESDWGGEESFTTTVTKVTLTASVVGGHGVISSAGGTYDAGTEVTLTATPDPGYRVYGWSGYGASPSYHHDWNTITVTMISDKTITVSFAEAFPITEHTLTTNVSPEGSGSVSPSSGSYDAGTDVTLTAYPNSGWEFDYWGGDASGTNTSVTITMNSNKNVTAYFTSTPPPPQPHTLTISSTSGGSVTEPGEGTFECDQGEEITIEAEADHDYHFTNWSGSLYSTDNPTTITMDHDYHIMANFEFELEPPTLLSPGSELEPGEEIGTLTPTLQWQGVQEADYYALAISEEPYGHDHIVYNPQELYGTSHQVPDGELELGKKYRWNMQAYNSAGRSEVSDTLYFQTTPADIAQLITQEAIRGIPVTVEGELYFILTLRNCIDPDNLEVIPDSGETRVYVNTENYPVSDPRIVQKISLIDFVQEKSEEVNLKERIGELEELQRQYNDFNYKDMALSVYNVGVSGTGDIIKIVEEMKVIKSAGDVLKGFSKIKDLAKTQPTGLLVDLIIWVMEKVIWDPMDDMKTDLQNRIANAIESYKSAQELLEQGDIRDYGDAANFLSFYQYGKLYEEQSYFLFEKIFKNYGRLLLKMEPISGLCTWNLSAYVKLIWEAKDAVDWTYEIETEWIRRTGEDTCRRCYWFEHELLETAEYTLGLAQHPLSDFPEFCEKYSSCLENMQKPIDELIAYLESPGEVVLNALGSTLKSWKNKLSSWTNTWKTRLSALKDKFSNFLSAMIQSPAELRIYDSQARVTGLVNGVIKEEIPNSTCLNDIVTIFFPTDTYYYEVAGTDEGTYRLDITSVEDGNAISFETVDMPTSPNVIDQYTVDWQALSQGGDGVVLQTDADGDTIFEQTSTLDTISLTVNVVGGHGTTTHVGTIYYEVGAIATVRPLPDKGYCVKGWYDADGVLLSEEPAIDVLMDWDKTISVEFMEIPIFGIEIWEVWDYNDPMNPDDLRYVFSLAVDTNEIVDLVEVLTPTGHTFQIPKQEYTDANGVETWYSLENGTYYWEVETWYSLENGTCYWEYEAEFNNPAGLLDYGDGTYTITVHYASGGQAETTALFGDPNTGDSIPQPTHEPVLTFPAHNGTATSPVTFTWQPCTDVNATSIWLGLEKQDANEVIDINFPTDATSSDPITLSEGTWEAKPCFDRWYDVNNVDVIPISVGKYSSSCWIFTVVSLSGLSGALDTALSFTTVGSTDWFNQTTISHYDGDAAQSGAILDEQDSWMQTMVSGKGTVKFYWKVLSEDYFDFLEFYIDGTLQEKISGSVNWQQKTYTFYTSGSHTLKWRYMKDGSVDSGSDCGWVDKVEWVPTP